MTIRSADSVVCRKSSAPRSNARAARWSRFSDPAGVEALVRGAIRAVPSHDVVITGPDDVMLRLEGIDVPRDDGLVAPAAVLTATSGSGGVTGGAVPGSR